MRWYIKNFINEKIEIKSLRFISNKSLVSNWVKVAKIYHESSFV